MRKTKKSWFSENENAGLSLTREELTSEIRRITALKAPIADKMREIRNLIEYYFKIDSNEELLNANLP